MMNKDPWEEAKTRYQSVEAPPELGFAVAGALRRGECQRKRRRAVRRSLSTVAAACVCFALLVNFSPSFAGAVDQVPVLGQLAQIFTVTQYAIDDRDHLINVRLPALEHTGHTDLEQRINTEIQARIEAVLQEAEDRAREARDAYVATGGTEDEFIPIIINVDYEVKCQNDQYLSFIINKTETLASAYTEIYVYNIDLQTGRELTLRDILGPDYKEIANRTVRSGIEERSKNPDNVYFGDDGYEEGFHSIADDQKFYLNSRGNPVVLFEKYEIAPGYMGSQEFEILAP